MIAATEEEEVMLLLLAVVPEEGGGLQTHPYINIYKYWLTVLPRLRMPSRGSVTSSRHPAAAAAS